MKVLIGAAASTILLAAVAMAQAQTTTTPATPETATTTTTTAPLPPAPPSRCPALPESPSLPDGATANAAAMQAGNAAYQAWGTSYQQVLQCRRTEVQELRSATEARTNEYNAGARALNETTASWVAESNEFNARQGRRNARH